MECAHYGSLRLFGDFKLQNLRDLVDALQGGDIACCMADVIPGTPSAEHAPPPDVLRYFGYSRQQFPRASAPVNFLGQRLEMTAWVGWLAAVSGAAVLPTIMLRKDDKSLELSIGPPVTPDATGLAKARDTINTGLYQTLEQYVTRHPSQWFAWHNLHHVGLRVPASDSPAVPVKGQTVTISS